MVPAPRDRTGHPPCCAVSQPLTSPVSLGTLPSLPWGPPPPAFQPLCLLPAPLQAGREGLTWPLIIVGLGRIPSAICARTPPGGLCPGPAGGPRGCGGGKLVSLRRCPSPRLAPSCSGWLVKHGARRPHVWPGRFTFSGRVHLTRRVVIAVARKGLFFFIFF